jgi:hypothetical protein
MLSIGSRANRKEERYEKEGQIEEEGNVKKWERAEGSAECRLPREMHREKSGPGSGAASFIVPKGKFSVSISLIKMIRFGQWLVCNTSNNSVCSTQQVSCQTTCGRASPSP